MLFYKYLRAFLVPSTKCEQELRKGINHILKLENELKASKREIKQLRNVIEKIKREQIKRNNEILSWTEGEGKDTSARIYSVGDI